MVILNRPRRYWVTATKPNGRVIFFNTHYEDIDLAEEACLTHARTRNSNRKRLYFRSVYGDHQTEYRARTRDGFLYEIGLVDDGL